MTTAELMTVQQEDEITREGSFQAEHLGPGHAELMQQIEVARRFPRNLDKVLVKLEKMTCFSQDIALTMFYSLPRKGKDGGTTQIIGPSVRFAEALVSAWGNCRAGAKIEGVREGFCVAVGAFFDCETNVGIQMEAQRRATDRNGRLFGEDMIGVTSNAAASVAFRNAVMRGVPKGLWIPIYEKAMQTAAGSVVSLTKSINEAMKVFNTLGITDIQVLNSLGIPSLRECTPEHVVTMRVLYKEVTNGNKTVEEVFGTSEDAEINNLMMQLGWNEARRSLAWREHKGNKPDLLKFVRTEFEKQVAAGTVKATPTPAAEPQQQAQAQAEPEKKAEPQQEAKATPAAAPAANGNSKPAAKADKVKSLF